ncbi:MAG: ROK family protein [Candidatus Alcyoniella australis]|nr:ROK family protein [Candidatus Alcyoniella australis]
MRSAIAIDLGGSRIKYGLVDESGKIIQRGSEPTGPLDVEQVAQRLAQRINALKQRAAVLGLDCVGAGLGVPGGIYEDRARISQSPNFPGWIDVDLRSPLVAACDLPVFLENDANAAAVGEHWIGGGRSFKHMMLYTLGTGVGSGLILDGRLWRGAFGMASEAGHICVDPDGPACGCGSHGCAEQFASAPAMVRRARQLIELGGGRLMLELAAGDLQSINAKVIAQAALEGDAQAAQVYREAGEALGRSCSAVLNVLNVELFLFGGGVGASYDLLETHIRSEITLRTFRIPAQRVKLGRAQLGNDAGMVGAARLALNNDQFGE